MSSRTVRRVLTVLYACLSLATTAQAQAPLPIDITQEVLTILDVPNAAGEYGHSFLADQNRGGRLVGGFRSPSALAAQEGSFWLELRGQAMLFHCGPEVTWTMAKAINVHTAIVGWCYTRTTEGAETVDGFYRAEGGRVVTRLRYPGARYTEATDVNDSHVVVGWFENPAREIHGYRWTRSTGRYEQIDAPFPGIRATIPTAITNAGHIVATLFTATDTQGALLRNGQWSTVTVPGAQIVQLEDLTDQGAILGYVQIPNQYFGSFFLEHGVAVAVQAVLPQIESSAVLAVSPHRQAVGYLTTTLRPIDPDGSPIVAEQGFVAPLQAVLGAPLTPPGPQIASQKAAVAPAPQTASMPALLVEGCPDDAPPAGRHRVGKLAMSWVSCERLRGQ